MGGVSLIDPFELYRIPSAINDLLMINVGIGRCLGGGDSSI